MDQTRVVNANSVKDVRKAKRERGLEKGHKSPQVGIVSSSGVGNTGTGSLRSLMSLTSLTTFGTASGVAEK